MIQFVTATLALLALWVGAGVLILRRGARPAGESFRREIGVAHVSVDEVVPVTLTVRPEVRSWAVEPHDVVILIDHSESMGSAPGSPLWTARRAVAGFIRRLPTAVHVGVVAFDHEARVLCGLTADRRVAVGAVEGIAAGGSTAIHLALDRAHDVLSEGREGVRRTLVLLSDGGSAHGPALEAAERLSALPNLRLVAVGVGPAVDVALMEQLTESCGPGRYVAMHRTTDIEPLFECLAAVISNGGAWSGAVVEPVPVPERFDLGRTVGLAPRTVTAEPRQSVISWSVPVLDADPAVVGYELTARVPGWHAVALDGAAVLWKLPDGSTQQLDGPRGPRVLVLPHGLGWAWPVLNPLFWMIAAPITRRRAARPAPLSTDLPPVERPSVPDLPPLPDVPAYQPVPQPMLVVGLGRFGERVAGRFAGLLADRGATSSHIGITAIRLGAPVNRAPAGAPLASDQRLDLCVDLRAPLLERRNAGAELPWLPSSEALTRTVPLSTVYGTLGDRRLARLAALVEAPRIAERLQADYAKALAGCPGGEVPLVALVASADDPEGSGLLAEVAHILSAQGVGVTAVLAPAAAEDGDAPGALGLSIELERLTELAGAPVVSERGGVAVRRLFDRVLVASGHGNDAHHAENITGLLWCWATLRAVPEALRPLRMASVSIAWSALPDLGCWRWVRAQALRRLVCERWLNLQGRLLPLPADSEVEAAIIRFLRGDDGRQPPGAIVRTAAALVVDDMEAHALLLTTHGAAVPVGAPDHEQIAWCDAERSANLAYLCGWANGILARERAQSRWGLPVLAASLVALVDTLRRAQQKVDRTQSDLPALALRAQFISAMLLDLRGQVDALRREAGSWIAAIAGGQPALTTDAPAPAVPAAALWLAEGAATEAIASTMPPVAKRAADACAEAWLEHYGQTLVDALLFEADDRAGRVELVFRIGERRASHDDLTSHLYALFDAYRDEVRKWPVADAFPRGVEAARAQHRLRVGRYAAAVLPGGGELLDDRDPFMVASLSWREESVAAALRLPDQPDQAIHVHAEEVHAAQLVSRVRHHLNRSGSRLPPLARAALRDPAAAWAFFGELAGARVREEQGRWRLERNGGVADLGPIAGASRLERFEALVYRVLVEGTDADGRPLAPSAAGWTAGPDEAWAALEALPLVAGEADRPEWAPWRTVVCGLALEHGRAPVMA